MELYYASAFAKKPLAAGSGGTAGACVGGRGPRLGRVACLAEAQHDA